MQNGITLIALVVTIVVLLILAGVSINLVIGQNGIITKAGDAKDATEQATVNDQIAMNSLYDELAGFLNGSNGGNGGGSATKPEKVAVGTKATANSTINGEEATAMNPIIPEGYIAIGTSWGDGSSAPTEENVNRGLVITDSIDASGDSNGNEWVWVPVLNASVMYEKAETPITLTGGTKDGAGILDLKIDNNPVTVSKYSKSGIISGQSRVLPNDTSSYREVDVVVYSDGTSYDAVDTNRATAGFTKTVGETTTTMTLAEMAQIMVDEYETMIASIEKYHGFYIGRYELTANGEKTGATLTNKSWYYLYNKCKGLSASNKVMSRMIWGCQWDVTCNWIANYGDQKNISDSSTWGNYRNYNTANSYSEGDAGYEEGAGSIQNTGSSDNWKANNIYDFAGNCIEWTQEANYTIYRVVRGGNCYGSGSSSPASDRDVDVVPTYDGYSDRRFSSHFNSATLRV